MSHPNTAVAQPDGRVQLGPAAAYRCRRRVHLEHDRDIDWDLRIPADAAVGLRRDRNAAHRAETRMMMAQVFDLVGDARWETLQVASSGTTAEAADESGVHPATAAAYWDPRLRSDTRFARPELLIRAPDGGYLPVLVRGHRTTDPGSGAVCSSITDPLDWDTSYEKKLRSHHDDALALAHSYRLLQELGMASNLARGGIIGFGQRAEYPEWDDGQLIVWHAFDTALLDDYDERFADRLAVAHAAALRAPALAAPSKISQCRRCPWWSVCGPELAATHDVSLLASGKDAEILRDIGVVTYDDVAVLDPAAIAELPISGVPVGELRTRARVMVADLPMVRRDDVSGVVRADVELDVDMESYSDDGAYLWGTVLSGPGLAALQEAGVEAGFEVGEEYLPFATWEPLDDVATATNFVAFWRYLSRVRATCESAGLTFAAYCYSRRAEERWLYGTPARFPDTPGMPSRRAVTEFCESPHWVDLYAEIKRCFVVPGSLRLKSVALLAGFAWRDSEPGGENSMAWYRIAVGETSADKAAVVANRERILQYNEDDVRATQVLRQWMSGAALQLPTVAELDARYE